VSSRACPEACGVWVENMRDEKDYGYRSDGYEYGTDNSPCKNWKKVLEVDQFGYIFVYDV